MIRSTYVFGLLLVFSASCVLAAEPNLSDVSWPQFRGPNGDGISQSTGLLTSWPAGGPQLVFEAQGAGRGYSSVSIENGRMFTMGDEAVTVPGEGDDDDSVEYIHQYVVCFDLASGDRLWRTRIGEAWNNGQPHWQGSRSTPTVDGDHVYTLTAHGDLHCLDTATGEVQWQKNLKEDFGGKKKDGWGYGESVLVDGDRLVCTPGGEKSTMVALNKKTGETIWTAVREGDIGAGHASTIKSNVAGVSIYVTTTGSGALGVRAQDGKVLWSYEIEPTTAIIPNPIVRDDLVFFTSGYGPPRGKGGSTLLKQHVSNSGEADVEELYPWNSEVLNKHGGVILHNDHVYGCVDSSGQLFCADLLTGEKRWVTDDKNNRKKASIAITLAEGHLYLRCENGLMILVKATPDGYEEISSFEIPNVDNARKRASWAHPVIAGGRLYLREGNSILGYELRKSEQ